MPDRIHLYGPFEVQTGSGPVKLGGTKPRAVLAILALDLGRVVSSERLIDGLWGDEPPDTATASLQVHVSAVRKALSAAGSAMSVETKSPGYRLSAAGAETDASRLESALREADDEIVGGNLTGAESRLAAEVEALAGPPLADLGAEPFGQSVVARLDELRRRALGTRAAIRLDLGLHAETIGELEDLVGEYPLQENSWGLLMTALYRSGRQADALSAYQRCRDILLDQLGVDPGSDLRDLEAAILRQDVSLDPPDVRRSSETADLTLTLRRGVAVEGVLALPDGTDLELGASTTLGRHSDCEAQLADSGVSRRHAEIKADLLGYVIVDLGSTNGTAVNGDAIERCRLIDGDVVVVGDSELVFRSGST